MQFDARSNKAVGCAIEVHNALGLGLLETVYEQCLAHELSLSGIAFKRQDSRSVNDNGLVMNGGYPVDLLVALKCIDGIREIHKAQLMTYLKLTDVKIGLLMNVNVVKLKEEIRRFVL